MAIKAAKKTGARNNNFIIGAIVVVAAVMFVVAFSVVTKMFETETYYVLNTDVPTRTQVSPEMLMAVTTSKDTGPAAAIGVDQVQTGTVYTKFPLLAGDILTQSNTGGFEDISTGVPDEYVITNFSVGADNAVGGRVRRGSYFDMLVTAPDGGFYPFVNVLVLDTTVNLSGASSNAAADTQEAHSGQTTQYVVGMTPENAAKLHHIMTSGAGSIKLVLSPRANEYQQPRMADYEGIFAYDQLTDGAIWPGMERPEEINEIITDRDGAPAREVGDYTFTRVDRDQFGRPTAQVENCGLGNAKINGPACDNLDDEGNPIEVEEGDVEGGEVQDTEESTEPNTEETEGEG